VAGLAYEHRVLALAQRLEGKPAFGVGLTPPPRLRALEELAVRILLVTRVDERAPNRSARGVDDAARDATRPCESNFAILCQTADDGGGQAVGGDDQLVPAVDGDTDAAATVGQGAGNRREAGTRIVDEYLCAPDRFACGIEHRHGPGCGAARWGHGGERDIEDRVFGDPEQLRHVGHDGNRGVAWNFAPELPESVRSRTCQLVAWPVPGHVLVHRRPGERTVGDRAPDRMPVHGDGAAWPDPAAADFGDLRGQRSRNACVAVGGALSIGSAVFGFVVRPVQEHRHDDDQDYADDYARHGDPAAGA